MRMLSMCVLNTCVCWAYAYHWSEYAKGALVKLHIIQLFVSVCYVCANQTHAYAKHTHITHMCMLSMRIPFWTPAWRSPTTLNDGFVATAPLHDVEGVGLTAPRWLITLMALALMPLPTSMLNSHCRQVLATPQSVKWLWVLIIVSHSWWWWWWWKSTSIVSPTSPTQWDYGFCISLFFCYALLRIRQR